MMTNNINLIKLENNTKSIDYNQIESYRITGDNISEKISYFKESTTNNIEFKSKIFK